MERLLGLELRSDLWPLIGHISIYLERHVTKDFEEPLFTNACT